MLAIGLDEDQAGSPGGTGRERLQFDPGAKGGLVRLEIGQAQHAGQLSVAAPPLENLHQSAREAVVATAIGLCDEGQRHVGRRVSQSVEAAQAQIVPGAGCGTRLAIVGDIPVFVEFGAGGSAARIAQEGREQAGPAGLGTARGKEGGVEEGRRPEAALFARSPCNGAGRAERDNGTTDAARRNRRGETLPTSGSARYRRAI